MNTKQKSQIITFNSDDLNVINSLNDMNINELQKLQKTISEILREKRSSVGTLIKLSLNVGDIVTVDDKKFKNEIFEVLKLNPKKVQVKRENGEIWNIPYNYINNI